MRNFIAEKLCEKKRHEISHRAIEMWHKGSSATDNCTAAELDEIVREVVPFWKRRWFSQENSELIMGLVNEAACFQVYDRKENGIKNNYTINFKKFEAFDPQKAKELSDLSSRLVKLIENDNAFIKFTDKWGLNFNPSHKTIEARQKMAPIIYNKIFPLLVSEFPQTKNIKKANFIILDFLPPSANGVMFCNTSFPNQIFGNPFCYRLDVFALYASLVHEMYHIYQIDMVKTDAVYRAGSSFFFESGGAGYYGSKLEREAYFLRDKTKLQLQDDAVKNLFNLCQIENISDKTR